MTASYRFIQRIGLLIAVSYGFVVCTMLVLRFIGDPESSIIAQINVAITLVLMPALVLFPTALVLRKWQITALLAYPFVTFLFTYMPFFVPRPINIPAHAHPIHVMTYNLHAEQYILMPMVDVISKANADVVTLQEMSPGASTTFETALAAQYPFRALYPSPDGNPYHGRGLLSRFPIRETISWPVEYPIPVRLMRTVVIIDDRAVTIYNFHAPPSYPIYGEGFDIHPRGQQIDTVLAMIAQETGAVLLMGDFNTNDTDANYPRIISNLQDTYREVGWGIGFTGPDWSYPQSQEGPPFIPINQRMDYIFHNQYFAAIEAQVWPTSGGSDHRPVLATLALVDR